MPLLATTNLIRHQHLSLYLDFKSSLNGIRLSTRHERKLFLALSFTLPSFSCPPSSPCLCLRWCQECDDRDGEEPLRAHQAQGRPLRASRVPHRGARPRWLSRGVPRCFRRDASSVLVLGAVGAPKRSKAEMDALKGATSDSAGVIWLLETSSLPVFCFNISTSAENGTDFFFRPSFSWPSSSSPVGSSACSLIGHPRKLLLICSLACSINVAVSIGKQVKISSMQIFFLEREGKTSR